MIKALLSGLLLSIILCTFSHDTLGQRDQSIPLPEFYGIYALIDGKLCGVTVPTGSCSKKMIEIKNGDEKINAFEYNKGLRFLVYQESPSQFVSKLTLQPLLFIRQQTTLDFTFEEHTKTFNVWSDVTFGMWEKNYGLMEEKVEPIQLLIKPFKQNAVFAVPAKELSPGLYYLAGADLPGRNAIFFWSGTAKEAEVLKCSNVHVGVMNFSKYSPC